MTFFQQALAAENSVFERLCTALSRSDLYSLWRSCPAALEDRRSSGQNRLPADVFARHRKGGFGGCVADSMMLLGTKQDMDDIVPPWPSCGKRLGSWWDGVY